MFDAINHNSKSQLAKLLATENINVQHNASAKTASFDVKNRVLTLPVWREITNDLYDMLVIHEVGHALDTPATGWVQAIESIATKINGDKNKGASAVKSFLNVIEDARIDKRQKRRFPGSRRNYIKGYKELIDQDFFGTAKKDINALSFIDRINIYFKGGSLLGIKFSVDERPYLDKIERAETFEEVVNLTEEIYIFCKEKLKDQDQPESTDQYQYGEDGDDSDDSDDGDDSDDSDDSEDSADDTDGEGEEESESQPEDSSAESEPSAEDADDTNKGAQSGSLPDNEVSDEVPEAETEKSWEQKQKELLANSDLNYVYVKLPKPNLSLIVDDYKKVMADHYKAIAIPHYFGQFPDIKKTDAAFARFKSNENASISFMVKEFEMRKAADQYSRAGTAKTGVINTNKLHSYIYNEDIFRRITTIPNGKSHGFVMFLDWSGSMITNLRNTVKQLISISLFCKRVQIPFEVYAFRSIEYNDNMSGENSFSSNDNELLFRNFKLRNILSSRMNAKEMNDALKHLWYQSYIPFYGDGLNSTPLNQAIIAGVDVVNAFRARTKVQIANIIFLTDGDSDRTDGVKNVHLWGSRKTSYILQDEKLKKSFNLNTTYGGIDSRTLTTTLLKILKERTNSNLLGFYIMDKGGKMFRNVYNEYFGDSYSNRENFEKVRKDFRTDGFIPVKTSGYDEYYLIDPKNLNIKAESLEINSEMTKARMAREFIKFSTNKSLNRVLLQRFITKISA